jgi:hypothetical protein
MLRALLVVALVAGAGRAEPNAAVAASRVYNSYHFRTCDVAGGASGSMFRDGYNNLRFCDPWTDMERRSPATNTAPLQCLQPLSVQLGTAASNCSQLTEALLGAYHCALGAGNSTAFIAANTNVTAVTCSDGSVASALLAKAWIFITVGTPRVTANCNFRTAQLRPCEDTYAALTPYMPLWRSNECNDGVRMRCSRCQPFFAPDLVTQPYVFLFVPALKLVLVKLFELFVLFRIANAVLHAQEKALREQPVMEETHDAAFVEFMVEHFLDKGRLRIRQRLTTRTKHGIDHVHKLHDMFKDGELHDGRPADGGGMTAEQRDEMTDGTGIVLQRAAFTKGDAIRCCVELCALGGVSQDDNDNDTRDNEVLDWYFMSVCDGGLRRMAATPGNVAAMQKCVNGQLELLTHRVILDEDKYRAHHVHLHHKKTVFEEINDEVHDSDSDVDDVDAVEAGNGVVDVAFRNAEGGVDVEYAFVCEASTPLSVLMRAVAAQYDGAHDAREPFGGDDAVATAAALPDISKMKVFAIGGAPLMPDATMTELQAGPAKTLCLYFTVPEGAAMKLTSKFMNMFVKAGATYDAFTSIELQLDAIRTTAVAAVSFELATFEREFLRQDTDKNLCRLLDTRPATRVREALVTMCGPEVIYQCDITLEERYEFRDAIPQVQAFEPVHGTLDPRPSYNRCYQALTRTVDWRGRPQYNVLRVFGDAEREALVQTLSIMYDAVKDRLLADNAQKLDNSDVVAIAAQFLASVEDVSRTVPVVKTGQQVKTTIFAVNVYVLLVSICFAIFFFAECAVAGQRDEHTSGWQQYEHIFFRFLNSGTPASIVFAAVVNLIMNGEKRSSSKVAAALDAVALVLAFLLVMPPFLTHVLPGVIAYGWIWVVVALVVAIPIACLAQIYARLSVSWSDEDHYSQEEVRKNRKTLKQLLTGLFLWVSFSVLTVLTLVFQTGYNHGFLLYRRGDLQLGYLSVLEHENAGRTLACSLEVALSTTFNSMQFASSFVG